VLCALAVPLSGALASVDWSEGDGLAWLVLPVGLLAVGGFLWGRWKALAWLGAIPWVVLAVLSDIAWLTGLWDRSDEYEPLPTTPFLVVFGLPILVGAVALGVAVRKASSPRRRPST
jgi:hypothetical protein